MTPKAPIFDFTLIVCIFCVIAYSFIIGTLLVSKWLGEATSNL